MGSSAPCPVNHTYDSYGASALLVVLPLQISDGVTPALVSHVGQGVLQVFLRMYSKLVIMKRRRDTDHHDESEETLIMMASQNDTDVDDCQIEMSVTVHGDKPTIELDGIC